ncbi:MAG: glycosyl hydrolase-related protein [Firmicutes bacterium]|nr:glycosyl hydrolase-related protein [Bacillota bacterium]
MNFTYERIGHMLSRLYPLIRRESLPVESIEYMTCGYKSEPYPPTGGERLKWSERDRFGGYPEYHAWFFFDVSAPPVPDGQRCELECFYGDGKNPQYMVYLDGKPVQGMDENHRSLVISGDHSAALYAYTGYNSSEYIFRPMVNIIDIETEALFYDIRVAFEIISLEDRNSKAYVSVRDTLNEALNLLDWRCPGSEDFYLSVKIAREYLKNTLYRGADDSGEDVAVVCIGHTHIDVAWLWTFAQTREKTERSFSTVVELMKRYPEYKFMSSQPQLYQFLKEDAPDVYREVKRLVAEGRWEVEGAMWVEADCNLPSGESLVRQIIYGKRFFREEFGVNSHVLWLPDVFGYSAALPQILKKSGVDKFVTSKISWNETNRIPHDIFDWQGIDGTRVFSYFLTAQEKRNGEGIRTGTTYNSDITPAYIEGTWARLQDKELTSEALNTFGFGDGGGGPTVKMLEYGRRMKNPIAGCPRVKYDFAGDFLDRTEKSARKTGKLPVWVGELYLEYHRGTYTSNAKNKKNNRKSEFLYMDAEALAVTDKLLLGGEYPTERLRCGWEKILLCQFHDVLPGSSIKPVYDDSDKIYAEVLSAGEEMCGKARGKIAGLADAGVGEAVAFNPNGFEASGTALLSGEYVYFENIPPMGFAVGKPRRGHDGASADLSKRTLENAYIRVSFDGDMTISSIYDKKAGREVLNGTGNNILAFEDFPRDYDAWEITNYYKEKSYPVNDVSSAAVYENGAKVGFVTVRKFLSSTITETVTITPYDKKIEFSHHVDWHERHMLVKTFFPAAVNADSAVYEIQYGHVTRPTHENTSWDAAKFEVCAHKYADVSEFGYGMALMSDCKYGYSCAGTSLSLTLLKCATYPNHEADQGIHDYTYSVLPHEGDFRDAGVVNAAYLLNRPLTAILPACGNVGNLKSFSLASADRENVIIECVKLAEDGDGIIVRAYDAHNKSGNVSMKFGFDVKSASLCDLLENEISTLEVRDRREISLHVGAFEIITLKLKQYDMEEQTYEAD